MRRVSVLLQQKLWIAIISIVTKSNPSLFLLFGSLLHAFADQTHMLWFKWIQGHHKIRYLALSWVRFPPSFYSLATALAIRCFLIWCILELCLLFPWLFPVRQFYNVILGMLFRLPMCIQRMPMKIYLSLYYHASLKWRKLGLQDSSCIYVPTFL